jgi:hypothetical protein
MLSDIFQMGSPVALLAGILLRERSWLQGRDALRPPPTNPLHAPPFRARN